MPVRRLGAESHSHIYESRAVGLVFVVQVAALALRALLREARPVCWMACYMCFLTSKAVSGAIVELGGGPLDTSAAISCTFGQEVFSVMARMIQSAMSPSCY